MLCKKTRDFYKELELLRKNEMSKDTMTQSANLSLKVFRIFPVGSLHRSILDNFITSEVIREKFAGTTELHYSTKKREYSFSMLKAFIVRHSSEYETSDNDRKVNRNI